MNFQVLSLLLDLFKLLSEFEVLLILVLDLTLHFLDLILELDLGLTGFSFVLFACLLLELGSLCQLLAEVLILLVLLLDLLLELLGLLEVRADLAL